MDIPYCTPTPTPTPGLFIFLIINKLRPCYNTVIIIDMLTIDTTWGAFYEPII